MRWFCGHLHVFPLAFIRFRFYFTAFWQANLRIFREFCKMCAICVYTKKMTHYFLKNLTSCFYSSSERTAIAVVCTLGHPEVVGKSSKMSQKYCIFYTQNHPIFCWFQIVVFILTVGTDWMMKKWKVFKISCSKWKPEIFGL